MEKHRPIQSDSIPVLNEASDHRKIREYYDRAACDDQTGKTYMISHGMLLWLKTIEKNCSRNSRPDSVHGLPTAQSGEFVVLIANLLEEV